MREGFETALPYRSVFGISKDGRPIYTPYYDNGETYDSCDVDECNGMMIDGHYSYVSTEFHPYVMGCYGPGAGSDYAQSCSQNPRTCGELAVVNMKESVASFAGWWADLTDPSFGFFGFFTTLFNLPLNLF